MGNYFGLKFPVRECVTIQWGEVTLMLDKDGIVVVDELGLEVAEFEDFEVSRMMIEFEDFEASRKMVV